MICKNCGANVDGLTSCPNCGTPVENTANPQYQNYNAYPNMYANNDQPPVESPTPILVFGILSLALSSVIAGIVFGILGLIKSKKYITTYGNISTQVRIGRGLSIAGIIVSAICIIMYIIMIIAAIIAGING